ncbi:hypothetical protein I4U23_005783 [Adineta vaga]|nr:hypothetical protein I4U23_005783 [Adineta vaga]
MNFKAVLHRLYEWLSTYNLFITELDVNDDDQEDSVAVVRHQRYTTWFYVLLLLMSLYVIFFVSFTRPHPRTIIVTDVTPSIFNELRLKYPTTLSCPCSKTTISFQTFVSNSFTFHPICSSVFVGQQWIEGLYLINASDFGTLDFRKTAHSQFKLLSNLCSYSKDTISQVQNDLNNTELVSVDLMSEEKIRNEIDAIVELLRDNVASHIRSSLTYLKIINQANYLITSLNTKVIISYDSSIRETIGQWITDTDTSFELEWNTPACIDIVKIPIRNATFIRTTPPSLVSFEPLLHFAIINGFFASCTTLEALLPSTLDCLYDINCIELLIEYFPSLIQMQLNWTNYVLPEKQEHLSLEDHLLKFFVQESLIQINICQLADQTIENAITHFINQSFISSSVLNESDFDIQLNSTLKQLYQSTIIYFHLLTDTAQLFLKVDQPYAVIPRKNTENNINFNPNLVESIVTNEMNNETLLELGFRFTNNYDFNSASIICVCATNPNCHSAAAIYDVSVDHENPIIKIDFIVPGWNAGCFVTDFLSFSTLECFYSYSTCLSTLNYHIKEIYFKTEPNPSWFDVRPLVYNRMLSHFPPNTTIAKIIKDMMVETWNPSFSYNHYYKACAPSYCTYSRVIRTNGIIDVFLKLMSTIGGISVSLRFITPKLIEFVDALSKFKFRRRRQQQQEQGLYDRLKMIVRRLTTLVYTTVVNLNIFLLRDFRSNIDRMTANRLGKWATRLYIVLFTVGLANLALYTTIHPRLLTKNFDKPSLNLYNRLVHVYKDQLECPCSRIAPTYNKYVDIQPIFHEICSSPFASDEWRQNVTINLIPDLSLYDLYDYRRFLSAHLQFLSGLCKLSTELIQNSVNQFLSCGLHSNCTSQASFLITNSSDPIEIKGLKIGCTPSESFLASTLECFYDISCINLIQEYTNYTNKVNVTTIPIPHLSAMINQSSVNLTIAELVNNLFIENWTTTMNYSSYFEQCSPLLCSYTYLQKFNSLYTITLLCGLQGGLTIVLKWISPKIIQYLTIVYQHHQKRKRRIQPVSTIEMMSTESVAAVDSTLISTGTTSLTNFPVRCAMSPDEMNIGDMNGDTYVDVVIFSPLQNTIIMMHGSEDGTLGAQKNCILSDESQHQTTITITDVNGDDHLDVVLGRMMPHGVIVLLGQGNGRFEEQTIFTTDEWKNLPLKISIADLNNDGCQDIIVRRFICGVEGMSYVMDSYPEWSASVGEQ